MTDVLNPIQLPRRHEEQFVDGCPWYEARVTYGQPDVKWCERTLCTSVNEPANAWSNLAFLAVALLLLRRRPFRNHRWTVLFSFAISIMGVLSFAYHATNNALTQVLDFFGMYWFCFLIVFLNMKRLGLLGVRAALALYVASSVGMTLLLPAMYRQQLHLQLTIAVPVALILLSEIALAVTGRGPAARKPMLLMLSFFALAITASVSDVTGLMCAPDIHWFQGHALWHVLAAMGAWWVTLHFASMEDRLSDPPPSANA